MCCPRDAVSDSKSWNGGKKWDNWKISHGRATLGRLYASLGIIGTRLRAALKLPIHHSTIVLRGLMGSITWSAIMPRNARLGKSMRLVGCFCWTLIDEKKN